MLGVDAVLIVTGGAGFIGSNLVKALNLRGRDDVMVVDDLEDGAKFKNIVDCKIIDYLDKDDFRKLVKKRVSFDKSLECVFHQGACSSTTEWNGKYILDNNYQYSKELLHWCLEHGIRLIYASSAAVYGTSTVFKELPEFEQPLNVYGYSKLKFDDYVRRLLSEVNSQVCGLRYFNVYGPREQHKGSMASVAFHHYNQLLNNGKVKLFSGYDGYGDGEQCRDFVYVNDAVEVNLWLMDNQQVRGVFNVGTGRAQSFNDVAKAVIDWYGRGRVEYIPFPEQFKGRYQSFTQADITALRSAGYNKPFKSVEEGVWSYLNWLKEHSSGANGTGA